MRRISHFNDQELIRRFEKRSDSNKIKILKKALERSTTKGGSYNYNLALAMGYRMSFDYTGWTTSKEYYGSELG